MKLLVIRHAPAGDRDAWEAEGKDDRLRPITADGKKQMRQVMTGLATLVDGIDVLASSPLVRALESAELVSSEYGCKVTTVKALEPERDPEELIQWLKEQKSGSSVAIVGHEPHLSTLMGFLITGKRASVVRLKKSGTALLELNDPPRPATAILEWLLPPRVLRGLRK